MECYATPWWLWRESGILYFLQSPPIPRILSSLFICRDFFSFCHFNRGRALLQARGLAMSARTRLKCKKEKRSLQKERGEHSRDIGGLCKKIGGCVSRTPLSCRKFSLWKIMESPWQEGITILRVDKFFFVFSYIIFSFCFFHWD